MDIYDVSGILIDAFGLIATHFFFLALFKNIRNVKRLAITYVLTFIIINIFYLMFQDYKLLIILLNIIAYVIIGCNYTESIIKCILASVFNNIFGIAVEFLVSFVVVTLCDNDYNKLVSTKLLMLIGSAICKLVLIFITYNMYLIFKKQELLKRPGYYWIIAVCFPICSISVLYVMYVNVINANIVDISQIFCVVICIFAMNIIAFVFYDQICNGQAIKEERDRIQNYVELQKSEQNKVDDYNKNITKISHDMKNYVLGVESLIRSGQYDKALNELADISNNVIKTTSVISSKDSVVNHILNAKLWNMEREGIRLERKINIEKEIPINTGDISVLLGNALDNAIEYVGSHKNVEQLISLDISYSRNIFMAKVSNPVEENIVIPKDMVLRTTKKTRGHGVGMKSVKDICLRYNGTFKVKCENKIFTEEIIMILDGDKNVKSSGV